MCVELILLTPHLCQHITYEGSRVRPSTKCGGCGSVATTRLRKKPGATATTPCQPCRDKGAWVLCEDAWMTLHESKVRSVMKKYMEEADRRVAEDVAKHPPTGRMPLTAEEARERVTTVFLRQKEKEAEKKNQEADEEATEDRGKEKEEEEEVKGEEVLQITAEELVLQYTAWCAGSVARF